MYTATVGILFRGVTGHAVEITLLYCDFALHVHVCVNPSGRGASPFSEWILGDGLWTKRPDCYWDKDGVMLQWTGRRRKERRGGKKGISDDFLTMTHFPFCFISTSQGNECMMEMPFHYEWIVGTDRGGPERGAWAFWRVNMWNSYANHYANCVPERMLAQCELFHSKQTWPELWIMTTSASARICKHRASDGESGRGRGERKKTLRKDG